MILPNKISTFGSLHGYMLENANYSLAHFVEAILAFRPDVILSEVRPEHPGPIEGSIDGGIEQSLVYATAEFIGAKVIPVDAFDDAFMKEMEQESAHMTPKMKEQLRPLQNRYLDVIGAGSVLELNADAVQSLIKDIYDQFESFGLMASKKRNDKICENINRKLKALSGMKVLIIFGLDHKYYIDAFIKSTFPKDLVRVDTWIDSGTDQEPKLLSDIMQLSVKYILDAKELLRGRLESKHYRPAIHTRLESKLSKFDDWVEALNKH